MFRIFIDRLDKKPAYSSFSKCCCKIESESYGVYREKSMKKQKYARSFDLREGFLNKSDKMPAL